MKDVLFARPAHGARGDFRSPKFPFTNNETSTRPPSRKPGGASGAAGCGIGRKLCSAFMSAVLAVSMCPAVSFADTLDGEGETGDAVAQQAPASQDGVDAAPVADGAEGADAESAASANADSAAAGDAAPAADNAASAASDSDADGSEPAGDSATAAESAPAADAEGAPVAVAAADSNASAAKVAPQDDGAAIEIYSAVLTVNGTTTRNVAVGDTVGVLAKDRANRQEISSDKLAYQWLSHDFKTGDFTPIEGATSPTYVVPAELEGKFIKCTVTVGESSKTISPSNRIAKAGSFYVDKVTVLANGEASSSSDKIEAGTVLSATAADSAGNDASSRVTWKWYASSSPYSASDSDVVSGETSSTFTVPSDSSYLGKYIFASANGGFGETKSQAAGQVGVAGAVDLHSVEASAPSSAVHVGDTLAATAYKNNSYTKVSAGDVVYYQWQYATSKTTSDSSFKDIPGATGTTYTVSASLSNGTSLLGCYLRVKATSNGSVVSTSKPSYYGSSSVDPLGPVSQAGQYTLDSVEVESSGQAMQVGATLTPTAQVKKGSWSSEPAPADAKLTYTWYKAPSAGAAESDWTPIEGGYDHSTGIITLDASLKGSYLKLKANALDNTVSSAAQLVVGAGEYDLLRITVSPSSGALFTQGSLAAAVQAKRLNGSTYGDDVTKNVSVQWYLADSATADDSTWLPISGATSAELAIPDSAAGKYLAVRATSGTSSVTYLDKRAVIDSDSLDAAVKKLNADYFKFMPQYGVDVNANDYMKAALAKLGYSDITVTTVSASMPNAQGRATATGGVSAAAADNGAITYFFEDPSTKTDYKSYTTIRSLDITFKLERNGETVEFTPSSARLAWDVSKVKDWVSSKQSQIAITYQGDDTAESVTSDLSLPYQLKANSSYNGPKLGIKWTSSDESAVQLTGSGWSDYTGKVTRSMTDKRVTLTATIDASGVDSTDDGLENCTCAMPFDIVVKEDRERIEADKQALAGKVEAGFTRDKLKYSTSGEAIGEGTLSDDVQLPRPKDIGVDGGDYRVVYTASNDNIKVNGYRANVYLLQPGASNNGVDITCTVTLKENSEVAASKTLSLSVAELDQSDIDRESALMDAAVAGYWDAISNGQSADAVTGDLHAFKKATYDASGTLAWAHSLGEADAAGSGIVAADLPGYDSMGSAGWRAFRSSNAGVVQHENLVLASKPTYNTRVTVDSYLQSEKYARYAERYPDNATFAKLAGTPVSATFVVQGSTGQNPPGGFDAEFQTTCAIYGPDSTGAQVPWAAQSTFTVKEGATADDITKQLIAQAGLEADVQGSYLNTITSPFTGEKLGYNVSTGEYWQLFVNGKASDTYADQVYLQPGDSVVWSYSTWGADEPVIKPDVHEGDVPSDYTSEWPAFATGGKNGAVITGAKTPTGAAKEGWTFDPFKGNRTTEGYDARGVSDPLIVNGDIYFIGGGKIFKLGANDGSVKASASTGFPAQYYFSRPAYDAGMIFAAADDGRVAAFAADTLKLVWCTDALPAPAQGQNYQSLSSITVANSKVYAAFTVVGTGNVGTVGSLVCIDRNSGNVLWTTTDVAEENGAAGYYWTGACPSGSDIVIADEAGYVKLVNGCTGTVKAKLHIGGASHSGVIALDDVDDRGNGTYLAVSRDNGTLHKIVRKGNVLSEQGSVSFAETSTSTPSVAKGKAFVCGSDDENYGTLSVIDLATMKVERTVHGGKGAAQSTPLVSVQGDDVYAYFTCNSKPGGVYLYKLGDSAAQLIFTPKESDQEYCTASVIADSNGNLYYTNDSHKLFKLVGGGAIVVPEKGEKSEGAGSSVAAMTVAASHGQGGPLMSVTSNVANKADDAGKASAKDAKAKQESRSTSRTGQASATDGEALSASEDTTRGLPVLPVVGICAASAALIGAGLGLMRLKRP